MSQSKRSSLPDLIRREDGARTHEDWAVLDATSLRLKCNLYNIVSTGKKDILIDRLLTYFQTNDEQSSDASAAEEENEVALDLTLGDHVDNEGQQEEFEHNSSTTSERSASSTPGNNNNKRKVSSEKKNGGRKTHNGTKSTRRKRTSPTKTKQRKPSPPAKSSTSDTVTPQQDDISMLDDKLELILSSLQATQGDIQIIRNQQSVLEKRVDEQLTTSLGSKRVSNETIITTSKKSKPNTTNTSTTSVLSFATPAPTSTSVPSNSSSDLPSFAHHQQSQQQQQQQQLLPSPSTTPASNGTQINYLTGNTYSVPLTQSESTDPWAHFRNPFLPPAIKESILKKIEDRTFVNFKDLHPDNQTADSSSSNPTIHIDQQSGLLSQKEFSVRKVKILSYPRWSSCWMIFAQAHLHYHPEDYFRLFVYQSIMVENFNTYKYEACLKYDADCRMSIANQRNLAPERQTVFWTELNLAIRNKRLSGNELTRCEYCKGTGHYASACRQKMEDEAKNLPRQIAAAITEVFPRQQYQHHASNNSAHQPTFHAFRGRQSNSLNNNNNNNDANNPSQNNIPPYQKPCRRFNGNTPCAKPPCQFLHACSNCGLANHNATTCYRTTSTNFIPTSK